MKPMNRVVCECCELSVPERLASADRNAHGLVRGWICRQCNEHRADPLRKAQEHEEEEFRVRWSETFDQLNDARDRAEDYREKMLAAFRSRDSIRRRFEQLQALHHKTGHGCICGKRRCEVLEIVDDNWIDDHIRRMHERDAM